jgi:hypothetical protein
MGLGPPVCVPCMCVMSLIERQSRTPTEPSTQWIHWRCSRCGHHPGGDPKHTSHWAEFPTGTHFAPSWQPRADHLALIEAGAAVRRRKMPPAPDGHVQIIEAPLLVTLCWTSATEVGWFSPERHLMIAAMWEALPGPTPMEQLAQAHSEERVR